MERIKNNEIINKVESEYLKKELSNIQIGDSVKLGIQIREGEKTRVQGYEGVVISKKNCNLNKTITVRKILGGIGIERCFLLHSPKIEYITIKSSAKVRRSKLYYLRKRSGKATRLKTSFK
jgi:large subunit ribosomal protein L19